MPGHRRIKDVNYDEDDFDEYGEADAAIGDDGPYTRYLGFAQSYTNLFIGMSSEDQGTSAVYWA